MKINYKNRDLKINRNYEHSCYSCAFKYNDDLYCCRLFCRSGKIWIKDIFNSDIFRL